MFRRRWEGGGRFRISLRLLPFDLRRLDVLEKAFCLLSSRLPPVPSTVALPNSPSKFPSSDDTSSRIEVIRGMIMWQLRPESMPQAQVSVASAAARSETFQPNHDWPALA
ncbi:hypothetical protein F441_12826 [Phytophthora nicotianae CJ01A1]|uniref:Uncharacterized protein n=2 Tax=Phytophthora nicotianae TaxID=4792 RepID=W2H3A7_PHYNI|nr:hypothetical protein L915_06867 [Phytophthora nicotianae]ETL42373.1 hypothetical protein L916_06815 [Phytophthora nicotianae]ETP11681.1 hypothetical protein F441_12826 [Phytophthora nicotianae CJ01A1]